MRHRSLLHILAFICLRRAMLWQWLLFSLSGDESHSDSPPPGSGDIISEIRSQGRKVLIIDDDDGFRKAVSLMLRMQYGVQVEDVDSGEAGIAKMQNGNSYDLILLDVMMPEMDGVETYYRLKQVDTNTLIVFMSVDPSTDEWKKAERLGEILPKPIPDDELTRLLHICGGRA